MSYFYIDFENVKSDGLNGISSLQDDDIIKIYYSKDANTLSFGLHKRINETKADVTYEKIDDAIKMSMKNALDIILLYEMNALMKTLDKNNEYFIVSEDKGYDNFISEKCLQGYKIKRISEIRERHEVDIKAKENNPESTSTKKNKADKTKMSKEEQAFRSHIGRYMKEFKPYKEEIIKAYFSSRTKNDFHNKLMSGLKDPDLVKQIYYCDAIKKYKDLLE